MTARQARKARKLEANRANAQKSTGPKTAEGKANSSRNSFKHGLYSKQLVLPGEDPAALDALKADLRAEHQPVNETEEILVNEMAEQYWRLRRARRLEAELLSSDQIVITHMAAIQRMMSSAERGFHKALAALRQLQKERGFVPQSNQNRDLACQRTSALAREGAAPVELTAENCDLAAYSGSRSESASALGFVPQNLTECVGQTILSSAAGLQSRPTHL